MTYVRVNAVDMLLIAGDMFDTGFVTRETVAIVLREFGRVPNCKIIISPGNHDPYTPDSVYAKTKFPDNVFIFTKSEMSKFSFPIYNCDVYGYAFTGETMTAAPLERAEDNGRIKLLCAHAHMGDPLSPYCPVSANQLAACGFDYAALGHVHNPPPPREVDGTVCAYCGCLEGRSYDETGIKGAVYIEINDSGKLFYRNISFSDRRYESVKLSVTGAGSSSEIVERIHELIKRERYGESTLLRVTLEGALPPSLVISPSLMAQSIKEVFAVDIKDATSPVLGGDYLESDPTVKGEFFRALKPKLESADPTERSIAARALRYGLAAMSGESLTD